MIDRRPTHVIRHPRENLAKCSLSPLHGRPDLVFHRWSPVLRFDATGFTLLAVDAPPISRADAGRPLLLLDSTWRLLPALLTCLTGEAIPRSLPREVETAYPRKSQDGRDPSAGLASVEALFVARALLGRRDDTLLDGYYWRDAFLAGLPPALTGCAAP